ncbi:MAG: hypothetical protein JEZ12_05230 [Desulfobacterium sp.]|nr:hypothetical protein [Desulfobacterium sp.]
MALFFTLPLFGCSPDDSLPQSGKNEILVTINNSTITLAEFNELIKFEAYVDPELDLTAESKHRFLNYLIRKELMIQEASRLKLDQKEEFVRTIEKYWESTLIRNLLHRKTEAFRKEILITDDEIETYYKDNKTELDRPLETAKDKIRDILESKKLEEKLAHWHLGLRKSASITINNKTFQKQ